MPLLAFRRPALAALPVLLSLSLNPLAQAQGPVPTHAPASASAALPGPIEWQRLRQQLQVQDYRAARPALQLLLRRHAAGQALDSEAGELLYRWLFASENLAEVGRRTAAVLEDGAAATAADLLAAARLALELRDFGRAEACLQRAQHSARSPAERASVLRGQGQLAYQRRDYDAALALHQQALALQPSADGEQALAETLIRLGRTAEAVAAAERAVALDPFHEQAHYHLGNGYARKNYSELAAEAPAAFAAANTLIRRAARAFDRGDLLAARRLAASSLARCPGHGRAHAVLAKAIEGLRLRQDPHRAADEARFAATPMPQVPAIERYVLNWAQLSPRHQKRVALSLAPWKAFIPVLVEGGATHFIKPLDMRLSETPGALALKDQRIGYDSRLWDDVRGMGGFNTVTGIEDVERSIFGRYNTVLHELSHQVHGVLTADAAREIQELYRRAKLRDERSKNGFLSRYAGGSVWEYFAEGANALDSPRRDAFDTREIVRERLQAQDPELLALVQRLFNQTDTRASLPIALVNAGHHRLESGELAAARGFFERARSVAPQDELVLTAALYGASLAADADAVRRLAAEVQTRYPRSGAVLSSALEALWHSGQPLAELTARLSAQAQGLEGEDRQRVDLALGGHQLRLGAAAPALAAFESALAYQSDSPEALWGKAAALAQAERWDEAFAVYEQALRLRTGLVELRRDLARDLLRAGRLEPARAQLKEAALLDPKDAGVLALQAWASLLSGDAASALRQAEAALALNPWTDLALIIQGAAQARLGRPEQAKASLAPLRQRYANAASAPHYVYRSEASGWISVNEQPAWERRLLEKLASE
ncbi:tetratricopeptide repeat protein [Paucibacter sp. DJ2R-2]|uniref:tetratricopeptide repeat protein n=1 Tax=Paucibacter sp. DJ2R-2 TaxID=2893558 RepID=UPI0021E38EC8|nr:tetratricopeptide repeat protein [Paucibacter sp. DJ2R-2]MCV2419038.1 tetratricopeptide repeat protein [Paucibacter sp. DJ4R-1]MCV2438007.1 tetratricopeptide repeat protein [Paucibacter sp. DJ2R-2]